MTKANSDMPKDLIASAILGPAILLFFDLLAQFGLAPLLAAIIGIIPGILWSKHKTPSWVDYQRLTIQATTRPSISTRVVIYFVLLVVLSVVVSIITHFFGSLVNFSIWGFLFGIGEGFVLWLLWLYFHKEQAARIS